MPNKLLTIALPTYNRAHLLDQFFSKLSIATESHSKKIEIVVSNNASSDNTAEVCLAWKADLSNKYCFRYYEQEKNIGAVKNILFLLEKAEGKFFIFLGDDDGLSKDGCTRIIQVLEGDNPPSAIIQAHWNGVNRIKNIGYVSYSEASALFYEYGNAWAGIIDTQAAVRALNSWGLRNDIEQIVWPQTAIGFLAMHDLKERKIFAADFEIGGPLGDCQSITNKYYWVTSLYGLLMASSLVDYAVGENKLRKAFVRLKSKGFLGHIRSILLFSLISENTSSIIVRDLLGTDFGLRGKFWSFVLFVADHFPLVYFIIGIAGHSFMARKSPLSVYNKFLLMKRTHQDHVLKADSTKKRFGDWF